MHGFGPYPPSETPPPRTRNATLIVILATLPGAAQASSVTRPTALPGNTAGNLA